MYIHRNTCVRIYTLVCVYIHRNTCVHSQSNRGNGAPCRLLKSAPALHYKAHSHVYAKICTHKHTGRAVSMGSHRIHTPQSPQGYSAWATLSHCCASNLRSQAKGDVAAHYNYAHANTPLSEHQFLGCGNCAMQAQAHSHSHQFHSSVLNHITVQ
jgi:hypothetical protein